MDFKKKIDLTLSIQTDGRGPSTNPLRGHQNATLRQPLES